MSITEEESACSFSRGGEFFAASTAESEVKVWDRGTGSLHQSLVCTKLQAKVQCLVWGREKRVKKRRSVQKVSSLLLGGGIGSHVVVWNVTKGEEQTSLCEHVDVVTCLDWNSNSTILFSGSKDKYVIEWNVDTGASNRKWKADKMGVQCLCYHRNGSLLLTAGHAIKLWNLHDYTIVKRFVGHSTFVKALHFISEEAFLSSAVHDPLLNVWQTSSSTALATLACEDEVVAFDCCLKDGNILVASLTQESCLLYEFPSTDLPASPITVTSTVQFVTPAHKNSTPLPIPLLGVLLAPSLSSPVVIAASRPLKPHFESLDFDLSNKHVCLVRDIDMTAGLLLPPSLPKTPVKSPEVTILGPGSMTLATCQLPERLEPTDAVLPLSNRLEQEATSKSKPQATPSASSLTQLLVQSVASGDNKLMEEVLRVSKEKIICATVQGLPVHVVLPFMRRLIELLQESPSRGLELSVWIKMLLSAHAAYLMTIPQLTDSLSGLFQLLESRVGTFTRLCNLQGKLELLLAQAAGDNAGKSALEMALKAPPLLTITLEEGIPSDPGEQPEVEEWESDQSECSSGDVSMERESSSADSS